MGRHKSFALYTHDLLCERVHGLGRRAEHLMLVLLLIFEIWTSHDRLILSCRTKDGRHRWHAVNLKCRRLPGIQSVAIAACPSQEGVFLLYEQVVEAIVVGATTHLVTIHSWRGVDTWHELGHLVVSTERSELLL